MDAERRSSLTGKRSRGKESTEMVEDNNDGTKNCEDDESRRGQRGELWRRVAWGDGLDLWPPRRTVSVG